MTNDRINEIMAYLHANYTVCVQTFRVIENTLHMVAQSKFAHEDAQSIMEAVLEPLGVSYSEIFSIADGNVPAPKKISVPVYARFSLGVKAWVEAEDGATEEEIRKLAVDQIIRGDYEADEAFDQEPHDVEVYEVDWDGSQEVDE